MRVCFSGTFNVLHNGHKRLLDKAFEIAGNNGTVFIGVTKGELLHEKKILIPFNKRVAALEAYLKTQGYDKQALIVPISTKSGPAASGDYDAIIVSPETFESAQEINKERVKNGKKPLKIVKTPFVKAEDNLPISSTRIINKEIDAEGNLLNTE